MSCFDGALDALARERDPLFQGMVYEALGEVLYLLALYNGSGETLKESFNALQSALQVFSREAWPEAWADIAASLARSLQVYGEQLRSEEAFERSIALCREALEIRTRRSAPLPWAGLRNNLASGLFLLGKARKDPDLLQEAADTFQDAITVYRSRGYKGKADTAAKNLERAETLHEKLSREGPSAPDTDWSLALDGDAEN